MGICGAGSNSNKSNEGLKSNPETNRKVEDNKTDVKKVTKSVVKKSFNADSVKKSFDTGVTMDSLEFQQINHSALRVTKYFKDQQPYTGTGNFKDPLFPPENRSVFSKDANGNDVDPDVNRVNFCLDGFSLTDDDIEWLRPKDFFVGDYAMFLDKIEFDDIRQGSIGNCYFMASISALTETPQIIIELFRQLTVQENGYYEVVLKLDGQWHVVPLDDYIPCNKHNKKPIFANPKGNELWALLLEKAWAKVNGGYSNTVAGLASEVIEVVTNFPYEYNTINSADLTSKEAIWQKILKASGNDYVMTTAVPPNDDAKDIGLITGHEYTLLYGKEAMYNGSKLRMCRVRNPWGQMNFLGDGNKNSNCWKDPTVKKAMGFDEKDENGGEFWINYDQFIEFFADVDVCMISDRTCLRQDIIPYANSKVPSIYELHLTQDSEVDFVIFKPYYRFIKTLPQTWTITIQMLVARVEDEKEMTFSNIWGGCEGEEDLHLQLSLKNGTYFLYIFVDYSTVSNADYFPQGRELEKLSNTFSVYCNNFFDLHHKGLDKEYNMLYHMSKSFINSQSVDKSKNYVSKTHSKIAGSAFYAMHVKNLDTGTISASLDIKATGVELPYLNSNNVEVVLGSKEELIICGYCKDMYSSHSLGFSLKIEGTNLKPHNSYKKDIPELKDCPSNPKSIDGYQWIYKKQNNLNLNSIVKTIDVGESIIDQYIKKYSKDKIEKLSAVPKLKGHDELNLVFHDKVDFGSGQWYLGEWRNHNGEYVMWGRGACVMDGVRFIGQFANHTMKGRGYRIDPDNGFIEGEFEDFEPVGEVTHTRSDGTVKKVTY